MHLDDSTIKHILLQQNYVSEEDLQKSEEISQKNNVPLMEQLLRDQLVSRDLLGQAISEFYNIEYSTVDSTELAPELSKLIPEAIAKRFRIVVLSQDNSSVTLATDNPEQVDGEVIGRVFPGKKIKLEYAFPENIDAVLLHQKKGLAVRFAEILTREKTVAPSILEEILEDAMLYQVSDIHFEPGEEEVRVRFRIDGLLQQAAVMSKETYSSLLRVVKLRAGLNIDEHTSPQDGAIRLKHKGSAVDLRISIIPAIDGEKIVIRLLSEYVKNLTSNELGLSPQDQALVMKIAHNPFGMILTVGPTGSGKTTTLYSLLKLINHPEINVMTIEDPVEYKVPGVNHIQVNPKTNLTFAQGLRSIVRQDPNIILVGEIRDKETAEIAANAALTGHLVLSSFHANDAATAFPRLLDMGIEPFLLSSTLEMVIGQRLVRRICSACRYSEVIKRDDLKKYIAEPEVYFKETSLTVYKGKGCKICNFTGYKGRVAVFELVYTTPELQALILKSPSTQQVWELASKQGAHTMFDDGLAKVKNGLTTMEELLRVVAPPYENIYKSK